MEYRKEIDGLRALAVLPVILYHSGNELLKGGYLGVDIFFVISGFLITSIIAYELANQKYSIVLFYERRARRILPALFCLLFFTTLVAFLTLSPESLKSYSQSLVSVNGFVSNIYYYLTSGYFAAASEELPLLHTWSLAVEEQFYVFFPILMSVLWFSRSFLIATLTLVSIASFLSCLVLIDSDPSANFYLLPSRAWELFAGALLALNIKKLSHTSLPKRELLSLLGFALLIISLTFFHKNLDHPSFPTIVPVLGTLLIIGFAQGTIVGKVLSIRPLVFIGLISYSLYLWHQPIFAFIRIKSITSPSESTFYLGIIISIIAAWLSYRFVETPFRHKTFLKQKQIFFISLLGLILFISIGLSGHFTKGWPQRFATNFDFSSISFSPKRYSCHANFGVGPIPENGCIFNPPMNENSWAVLGDSHGVELSYALGQAFKGFSSLQQLTYSGCPPALEFMTPVKGCHEWVKDALNYLTENKKITHVILAFRHTTYLQKNGIEFNKPRKVESLDKEMSNAELHSLYWYSFESIVSQLKNSNKEVIILFPVPEPLTHIEKLTTPITIFHDTYEVNLVKQPIKHYFELTSYANGELNKIVERYALESLNPFEQFCDNQYCYSVIDDKAVYFDNNHLSNFGASLIADKVVKNNFK